MYKTVLNSLVAITLLAFGSLGLAAASIVAPINTPPAQASKFTKVKEVARKACEIGGCFFIVEQVVEYFQTPSSTSNDPDCSLAAKGCTIRTGGGSDVKIGETRTIIRKVRIR
jgi:hypothetical protein